MTVPTFQTPGTGPQQPGGTGFANWGSQVGPPPPVDTTPSTGATPGTYNINPLDPGGTAAGVQAESGNFLTGIKDALFGSSAPDAQGKHGGLLGDFGPVGDVARAASETVANVGGAVASVPGHLADLAGGTLEHISVGNADEQNLRDQFAKLPDSPEKAAAQAQMAKDPGAATHYMSLAVRQNQESLSAEHPNLYAGMVSVPGSVADTVTNLFGIMGIGQRTVERGLAGAGRPGADGQNQLQMVMSVGSGEEAWTTGNNKGKTGFEALNPAEQLVYTKVKAGDWTSDQGLDFLASHGAGLSHDQLTEIAGTFATDPLTIASLGAGALAKAGETGVQLLANTSRAEKALAALEASGVAGAEELKAAQVAVTVAKAQDAALTIGGRFGGEKGTELVRLISKPYVAIQDTSLGQAAHIIHNIADPFKALGDIRLPGSSAEVDLMGDATSKAVVAAMGDANHLGVLDTLHGIDPELYNQFTQNLAVYSANTMRRVVGVQHRAAILSHGLGETLASVLPGDAVEAMLQGRPKGLLNLVTEEAQRFRILNFDEANATGKLAFENLTNRMEKFYGVHSADEWAPILRKMNPDQLSLLHASTYGKATQMLLDAVGTAAREGSGMSDKLQRLVLLNRNTLTTLGASGILDRIAAAKDMAAKIAELRAAQDLYPELRYFSFEPANALDSMERFTKWLSSKTEHLPMQVTDDELKTLHPDLQTLNDGIDGAYTLGFRPEDEFLWGLERPNAAEGKLAPVGDVWVDHVGQAASGPGYRAGRYLTTNFRGKPILGAAAQAILKPIDYLEAMGRTMTQGVSGSLIQDAARAKFISRGVARHGMTEDEGKAIFEALGELTGETSTVANPRGLSPSNMWAGAKGAIPQRLKDLGTFDQRDLLSMVLDAYDGDIRFIGATQKLTARAKSVIGGGTGVNFLGQVSEHLYPLIKFRLNAIFQLQEKIEPWVLNAQRGAQVALGTKMTEADLITQRGLENMVNTSLVRMGDADQFEFSAGVLHAGSITRKAADPASALGKMRAFSTKLTDVQGVKRLNMLRTFRKGLGKELKDVWESHSPGVWDQMKVEAQNRAGTLLHDDDFAVQLMGEQMLGNDIVVNRLLNAAGGVDFKADFKAAIAPGTWAAPTHIGEMKPLELDTMAGLLGMSSTEGKALQTQADIRAAIAAGKLDKATIGDALARHGADPDYIKRVNNALDFSWPGFWQTVGDKFHVTPAELRPLQEMMAQSAALRGMTPIDYMSQVFSPNVLSGQNFAVTSMEKALAVLRAPVDKAGESVATKADLYNQLSSVFSQHLDPSAKRALLLEFKPELHDAVLNGTMKLDLNDIDRLWTETSGDNALAQSMMSHASHQPIGSMEELVARKGADFIDKSLPKSMPVEMQAKIVPELGNLTADFPDITLKGIRVRSPRQMKADIGDQFTPDTQARTYDYEPGVKATRIDLNSAYFGKDKDAAEKWAESHAINERGWQENGRPVAVSDTPEGAIRHEFGHAVDEHIRAMEMDNLLHPYNAVSDPASYEAVNAYRKFVNNFAVNADDLSTYAGVHPAEAAGELFDLAYGPPEARKAYFDRMRQAINDDPTIPPEDVAALLNDTKSLDAQVDTFKGLVEDTGLYKPMTNNADVTRANQMFAKWSTAAVQQGLLKGKAAAHSGILQELAGISTEGAVPYNLTEARLIHAATDAMTRKWADAFRLQYFSQSRSMLERSINHPMFGIYPASYMWGKLMPEVVRFIAKEPFGLRTGAAAYALSDVAKAVNVQREFDPDFDKLISDLGHSQAMWFLGYLLPTVPWDVSASWPTWMRDLAAQGLANEQGVAAGSPATQPDVWQSIKKQSDIINPLRALTQVHAVGTELDKFLKPQPAPPVAAPFGQPATTTPNATPPANTDAGTGPIQGVNLGPTLQQQMQLLKDSLGH